MSVACVSMRNGDRASICVYMLFVFPYVSFSFSLSVLPHTIFLQKYFPERGVHDKDLCSLVLRKKEVFPSLELPSRKKG